MVIGTPCAKDDLRGFRIDIDVEFGRRRDVAALEIAAAHQHDLLNPLNDVRRALDAMAMLVSGPSGQSVTVPAGSRAASR
jgi:hypothetical protein